MLDTVKDRVQPIFVSSTFKDMQVERDLLRDEVLPKYLSEFAGDYGKRIEFIDLRWGIDTSELSGESEQNRLILSSCFDEIDRCKPLFIGLIGYRYGSVPEKDVTGLITEYFGEGTGIGGKSVTALEIEYAAFKKEYSSCLFYFREIDSFYDASEEIREVYSENEIEVKELKERLISFFGDNTKQYRAVISENGTITGLDDFVQMIVNDIKVELRKVWGEKPPAVPDKMEMEIGAHLRFTHDNVARFSGRKLLIDDLRAFCESGFESSTIFQSITRDTQIFLLTGCSGSGKSALISKLLTELSDTVLPICIFCGISPLSSSTEGILRLASYQLSLYLGTKDISDDFHTLKQLNDYFQGLLERAAKTTQIAIILDAFEQLHGKDDEKLIWLIGDLPNKVKVLLTSVPGVYDQVVLRLDGFVEEIPNISNQEILEIIDTLAANKHKKIANSVKEHICMLIDSDAAQTARNPLFISLVVHDLIMLDRFQYELVRKNEAYTVNPMSAIIAVMKERIKSIPLSAEGAFLELIKRINLLIENGFVSIASGFASSVICMLAASRYGLRECDIRDALINRGKSYQSADFAWLRNILPGVFTQNADERWNLTHQLFCNTIWKAYNETVHSMNTSVLDSFIQIADKDVFAGREVMHHLYLAGMPTEASQLLAESNKNLSIFAEAIAEVSTYSTSDEYGSFRFATLEYKNGQEFLKAVVTTGNTLKDYLRWVFIERMEADVIDAFPEGTPLKFTTELLEALLPLMRKEGERGSDFKEGSYYKTLENLDDKNEHYFVQLVEAMSLLIRKLISIVFRIIKDYKSHRKHPYSALRIGIYSQCIGRLAELYRKTGSSAKSLELLDQWRSSAEFIYRAGFAPSYYKYTAENLAKYLLTVSQYNIKDGFLDDALVSLIQAKPVLRKYWEYKSRESRLLLSAYAHSNLGDLYLQSGDYARAYRNYSHMKNGCKKLCGLSDKHTLLLADAFCKMGLITEYTEDSVSLEKWYTGSMKLYKRIYDQTGSSMVRQKLAESYRNLAKFFSACGDHEASSSYISEAEVLEKKGGNIEDSVEQHSEDAMNLHKAGDYYESLGEYDKALAYHKKAMKIHNNYFDKECWQIAHSLDRIGGVYFSMKKYKEALEYNTQSLEIRIKIFGRDHVVTGISYNNIALVYLGLNDYNRALEYGLLALPINEMTYGEDNSGTITMIQNIGVFYAAIDEYYRALDYLNRALTLREKFFGMNHRDTALSNYIIGNIYEEMGDYNKAKEYFSKAYTVFLDKLGPDHPETVRAKNGFERM